jgi:ribonuclease HI
MQNKKTKQASLPTGASHSWKRMRFKNNKVWVAVDTGGALLIENGKHLLKYQLEQEYSYWVRSDHVKPLDAPAEGDTQAKPRKTKRAGGAATSAPQPTDSQKKALKNTIHIYTDGASSGNPGPSGIGVLLRYGDYEKKISRYIGQATNNIAELEAIRVGLSEINNPNLPALVYTDSSYAYGLLMQNWKAKKNQALVDKIRTLISKFTHLRFVKVQGHAGDEGNEIADRLATAAIKQRIDTR